MGGPVSAGCVESGVKRYCITDSIEVVRRAVDLGADLIQIRAKELSARELMRLVEQAVAIAGRRALVNTPANAPHPPRKRALHQPEYSPTPASPRSLPPVPPAASVLSHSAPSRESGSGPL